MALDRMQSSPTNVAYCNGLAWMGSISMLSLATIFVDGLWIIPYQVLVRCSMWPAPMPLPHLGVTWCMLSVIVKMIFRELGENVWEDTMMIEGCLVVSHQPWDNSLSHVLVQRFKLFEIGGSSLTLRGVYFDLHSYSVIPNDSHYFCLFSHYFFLEVGNYVVMIPGKTRW